MNDVAPRLVQLAELRHYALDEAYRSGLMAEALKGDRLTRLAGIANEHRSRMHSAVAALCWALISQDKAVVRQYLDRGISV